MVAWSLVLGQNSLMVGVLGEVSSSHGGQVTEGKKGTRSQAQPSKACLDFSQSYVSHLPKFPQPLKTWLGIKLWPCALHKGL